MHCILFYIAMLFSDALCFFKGLASLWMYSIDPVILFFELLWHAFYAAVAVGSLVCFIVCLAIFQAVALSQKQTQTHSLSRAHTHTHICMHVNFIIYVSTYTCILYINTQMHKIACKLDRYTLKIIYDWNFMITMWWQFH